MQHIIFYGNCGDFGFWADTPEEKYWLDWLEMINQRLEFHYWLCGHYHDNRKLTEKQPHECDMGKNISYL